MGDEEEVFARGEGDFAYGKYSEAAEAFASIADERPNMAAAWVNKGAALLKTGDVEGAQVALEKGLELDQKSFEALLDLGIVYNLRGEFTRARDLLQQATVLSPEDPDPWLALGASAIMLKDLELAESCLRRALGMREDPKVWMRLASVCKSKGDTKATASCLTKVLAAEPKNTTALKRLGLLAARSGKLEKATECFSKLVELEPGDVDGWTNGGRALMQLKRTEEATRFLTHALELRPEHVASRLLLARGLMEMQRFAEAIPHMEMAAQVDPQNHEVVGALADAFKQTGDNAREIEWLGRLFALRPEDAAILSRMARAYHRMGRLDEAVHYYGRAVTALPGDLKSREALADIALGRQDHMTAAGHLKSLLSDDPKRPDRWRQLVACFRTLGELGKAADALDQLVGLDGQDSDAWTQLAELRTTRQEWAKAAKALERLADVRPSPAVTAELGRALAKAGNEERAFEVLIHATSGGAKDPLAWRALGDLYKKKGDHDKAMECFVKVVELDPGA
ncbi:MAG: tetratricopeptide repeat protein [Methanopyri archaeon]|nr:tetratricopeptide repeat protein [Methanopyri archaeon]